MDNFGSRDIRELIETHKDDTYFRQSVIWGNAVQQIMTFLLPVLIFARWSSKNALSYIGFHKPDNTHFRIGITILVALVMLYGLPRLGVLIQQLPLGEMSEQLQALRKSMEQMYFEDNTVIGLLRNIALMAAIPAVCEELFFRGVFQRLLFSRTQNMWISIILTGVFFTFLHASLVNFLPILLAAVIMGLIYHYTKNLWYSIITHFIFNGVQVIMNYINRLFIEDIQPDDIQLSVYKIIGHAVFAIISLILIYFLLRKYYISYKSGYAVMSDSDWSLEDKNYNKTTA